MHTLIVNKFKQYLAIDRNDPKRSQLFNEIRDLIGGKERFDLFLSYLNNIDNLVSVMGKNGKESNEFNDTYDVIKMTVDTELFDIAVEVMTHIVDPPSL